MVTEIGVKAARNARPRFRVLTIGPKGFLYTIAAPFLFLYRILLLYQCLVINCLCSYLNALLYTSLPSEL